MKFLILVLLKILSVNANYENVDNFTNKSLFKCKGTVLDSVRTLKIPQNFMDIGKPYIFRLETRSSEIDCSPDERFIYTANLKDGEDPEVEPLLTTHGILMVNTKSHRVYRTSKDFCVESIDENSTLTFSVCNASCDNYGSNKLCIKKCCGIHKILGYNHSTDSSLSCQVPNQGHSNLDWKPVVYHDVLTKLTEDEHLAIQPNFFNSFGFYNCISTVVLIQTHPEFSGEYNNNTNIGKFRVLKNGDLAVCSGNGKWVTFKDSTYCVDSLQNFGQDSNSPSGDLATQVVIRCLDDFPNPITDDETVISKLQVIIYKIMIPISSFFLFMIIVVYYLLWENQNVHGYTMFSYSCSLFLLYATLCAQSFLTVGTPMCKFVAVALHFFFISTFCFLTTINFDIFYTFRNLKVCTDSKNVRRYLLYLLFSIFIPVIIISIGWSLDTSDDRRLSCETEENASVLAPRYGQKVCGVDGDAQAMFMYLPVGLLMLTNAVFFGMTIYIMHKYRQGTDAVLKGKSTKEDNQLVLFGKLFIVMGVSWVLEFVGWALKHHHGIRYSTVGFIFIFDCINVLQALVIFYIFVCKKTIFDQLWQNHLWLRPLLSLFIKMDCYPVPLDSKRPSLTTQVSTLGRCGRWSLSSRKPSTVSLTSNLSTDNNMATKESTTEL